MKYTDGPYVIRTLNAAFNWNWDFVADCEELLLNNGQPFEVKVRGTLTVRLGGQAVTKTQYGCQPIEMLKSGQAPVSIGDAYKGAATDALKKCASMLGIALDLYDSDYRPEKYEQEVVRDIKLAGAQPTSKATGYILAKIQELGWGIDKVKAWIEAEFAYSVVTDDLGKFFDSLGVVEQRKIFAALREAR